MLFDDVFYPGNPGRRQQVSDLRGQIRADFMLFKTNWNSCANLLNGILAASHPELRLLTLVCNADSDTATVCCSEFNSVLADAKPKLDKLVRDIGLADGISGMPPGSIDMDPEAKHKINQFITGAADAAVAAFATWYVYSSIQFFVIVINMGGAAISSMASFLGGALGGLIVGAVGFVITDLIASAITGAVERRELNEAIDALTTFRDQVADKLLTAAGRLAGIVQAMQDGTYLVSDTILIVRINGVYQVIDVPGATVPATTRKNLIRQDFSDCTNANVSTTSGAVGGAISVSRSNDANYHVRVALDHGTPSTTYHFFLKCVGALGDVTTDTSGSGSGLFSFAASSVGPAWGFDMYPEGAPAGNKFQSEQFHS